MDYQEDNKEGFTISPAIVFGFAAAVAFIVPLIKNFGCLLIIPLAVAGTLYAELGINKFRVPLTQGKSAKLSISTAVIATVFTTVLEVVMTLIFKDNDFVRTLPEIKTLFNSALLGPEGEEALAAINKMMTDIQHSGFSLLFTIAFFFSNLIPNSVTALIGSAFIHPYFNRKFLNKDDI